MLTSDKNECLVVYVWYYKLVEVYCLSTSRFQWRGRLYHVIHSFGGFVTSRDNHRIRNQKFYSRRCNILDVESYDSVLQK